MSKKNKGFVQQITDMDGDFAQWYTDVVKQADLIDYGPVRGTMIMKPYGYALWEHIRDALDNRIKQTGHSNVQFPLFIPESLLQKEKDHIEGFAPEVAWVTHGGSEELHERLVVRPTSEVLFCDYYARNIHSYRDLPMLYNQWANVVRWEKTTRPFLRSLEFQWQEGHTAHATHEEAEIETRQMLDVYTEIVENQLAIPVIRGTKTENEKFAGAVYTLTIESLMHDGKALQSGTSHHLGTGFAESFNITYLDEKGTQNHVHQTSWGITTRLIGAIIMVHGDQSGLVLPPKVAPIQAILIPIAQHKDGVLDKARAILHQLTPHIRIQLDDSDKTPGWKFNEHEMKGVPIRIELGPKDIEKNQAVLVRRDTREKIIVSLEALPTALTRLLEAIQSGLYQTAKEKQLAKTTSVSSFAEFTASLTSNPGFIRAMWCGDTACEKAIKEQTGATARCIPFEQASLSEHCVYCDKEAQKEVYWGKAY